MQLVLNRNEIQTGDKVGVNLDILERIAAASDAENLVSVINARNSGVFDYEVVLTSSPNNFIPEGVVVLEVGPNQYAEVPTDSIIFFQ